MKEQEELVKKLEKAFGDPDPKAKAGTKLMVTTTYLKTNQKNYCKLASHESFKKKRFLTN